MPDKNINFLELIETRHSAASFEEGSVSLQELSYLLWCTQGVKMVYANGKTLRNVPATCGVHALETFLLVREVEDLKPGLYHFLPLQHALEKRTSDAEKMCGLQSVIFDASLASRGAVTFLWQADLPLAVQAYGERALYGVYTDVGYVCQNLYLTAAALKLNAAKHDRFDRASVSVLLGLDGELEPIVLAATVGR
ncbi:SagB/ThcOx family dehydrogenase [Selenomonas sp. TAMA-11512]|uniref:SagB/ThcOx family dehydrogenase n=1 Tax=Selenomonas sp. TAMA-11512 TaxID=3095337 RepID=UPI0030CB34F9